MGASVQEISSSGLTHAVNRLRARLSAFSGLPWDLFFYGVCLVYAIILASTNEFYGFRVWGNFAIAGYGLAFVATCWLMLTQRTRTSEKITRARWIGVSSVGVLGIAAPLITLVVTRLRSGDWLASPSAWTAQPEVWVIERSARLLLDHGTPYVDIAALSRPPVVNDYTPYGPVMTVFGLPKALLGGSPVMDALTDARLMFLVTFLGCLLLIFKLFGWPAIPVSSAHLVLAFPMTALTAAVAGPDLAMLGLLLLAVALATKDKPVAAGIVLGLVGSAKLLPFLAAPVLVALVFARCGKRGGAYFLASLFGTCVVANIPVFLVDPSAFWEHVIRFPAGIGIVPSPAASPLPGYLIASIGPLGKIIAFALLASAAIAIGIWLFRTPPKTGAQALARITVGLLAFTLLTTATRYGYLIYPWMCFGAIRYFRQVTHQKIGAPTESTKTGFIPQTQ